MRSLNVFLPLQHAQDLDFLNKVSETLKEILLTGNHHFQKDAGALQELLMISKENILL